MGMLYWGIFAGMTACGVVGAFDNALDGKNKWKSALRGALGGLISAAVTAAVMYFGQQPV